MSDRSKREIDSWVSKQLSEGDVSDVNLNNEEARVIRKWDMIQQGVRADESLTVEERETLRQIANRSP